MDSDSDQNELQLDLKATKLMFRIGLHKSQIIVLSKKLSRER